MTYDVSTEFSFAPDGFSPLAHLSLGLLQATDVGHFDKLAFDVVINGVLDPLLSFDRIPSDIQTYFDDHVLDLGTVSALGAGLSTIDIALEVTSSDPSTAFAPDFILSTIPEPPGVTIFAAGLIGLIGWRRIGRGRPDGT